MEEQQLLGSNKKWIEEAAGGCIYYAPCPICNKCTVKASHLHVRCQNCNVPFCVHTSKQKAQMIRRDNFVLSVSDDVKETLKRLAEEAEMKRRNS